LQVYDNYREVDGVMVPQSIEQQRGGGGIFGVIVADADVNPSNLSELMAVPQGGGGGRFGGPGGGRRGGGPGAGAAEPDPMDMVEDLGGGAWLITGGYQAIAVEFEDHVKVFEAGQPESRGDEIIAAVAAAIPDKPLTHIINSHPHSDHTGGIIPLIRAGATLVTHENNVKFLDMALNAPRTLLGEPNLNANVEGVSGVTVYEDSMNRLELHSIPNLHTDGMLVAVLPKQGVLFQADFTLPTAGAEANPFVMGLAQYVADNDVQFDRYIAVHAATVPQSRDDLLAVIQ
jgi:glyoxylase-like metal-dependent hydrolase (beta-lactamase superfamily II)